MQGKHQQAVKVLRQVVAFDPALEADSPEEKIHLQAAGNLALASDAELITPGAMIECRKRLANMGELTAPPLVLLNGVPAYGMTAMVDGTVLANVTELAALLHLQLERDTALCRFTFIRGDDGKTLALSPGNTAAVAAEHVPQVAGGFADAGSGAAGAPAGGR